MPTNRDLLIAQRKRELNIGLPEFLKGGKKGISSKINRVAPKKTGTQTRGLDEAGRPVLLDPAATKEDLTGLATEGMKDIATPIKKRFPAPVEEVAEVEPLGAGEGRISVSQGRGLTQSDIDKKATSFGGFTGTPGGGGGRKSSSFGLPTDRLPSFSELGGAIGQMFKFVGGLTKKREALGLIPGKVSSKAKGLSLTQKDRATILAKRLDDLTLTDTERTDIKAELDAILNPQKAREATDIETILNE